MQKLTQYQTNPKQQTNLDKQFQRAKQKKNTKYSQIQEKGLWRIYSCRIITCTKKFFLKKNKKHDSF